MKVLIGYTTKKGSTKEVAERVGGILQSRGFTITTADLKGKPDPSMFDAVILGAPVMMGSILHRAPRYVKKHLNILEQKPFACFILGGMLAEDTEENRSKMHDKLKKITGLISPIAIGLFGGKYDEERDYRDWEKIGAWAQDLISKLKKGE